jgi:hypothetical protein
MRGPELTENLQVVTLEAECLIHVLQQSAWCGDQNIHPSEPLPLIL